MTDDKSSSKLEKKKYKVPNATEILGERLKEMRLKLYYSLSDAGDLTGFSTSTIVDIENGTTSDINYYIVYAQALNYLLPDLFCIDIPYGARFPLSEKKVARIFITHNIKKLYTDYDFFSSEQSVGDVAVKLQELNIIKEVSPFIRTRVSGVLLNLVDENILLISRKKGRNNIYLKKTPVK